MYPHAENTIVITGDYLCFLFAAINNVDCVFLGASNYLFYSDKRRSGLNPQIGGNPPAAKRKKEPYFYTEEDYMDDFYTLLKNIRHNTMSWHYETVDIEVSVEENYYRNIYTLIENFNFENSFNNFKTSLSEDFNIEESNIRPSVDRESKIYKNIDSILQVLRYIFDTTRENTATPALPKNTAANTFLQTQIYSPLNKSYEYDAYRLVYELAYKKIFLMSICILFEYLSLYYEKDLTIDTMQFRNPNIKPGFPHIIESFYYFIITNKIYKRNHKFNLKEGEGYLTIIRFLAITYSLLGKNLLGEGSKHQDYANLRESFSLQGFFTGTHKDIFLANYYPEFEHADVTGQDYYKDIAKNFLFPTPPSSSQSQGGARKNKMILQIKNKKTKRKHKKRKTKRKRKRRRQKEEDKKKKTKRKKTRRKKVIKRKKHTRRKHLNKSK